MDKKITILTVNYKTADFIDLMLHAFEKLTKNPYKVIICDNYTSDKEVENIGNVAKKYTNTEVIYRKQTQFGSVGHAEAMDILVSKVDTPYFVTMDADCTFLLKNWDETLISKIDDKVKVIGTTIPEGPNNTKPMDFPLVFAVLFETKTFKELNPSFLPGKNNITKFQDTGWEIREKYLSNGYKGKVFDGINTRFKKNTPYKNMLCAVYYIEDKIIASHFSRGSSDGVHKYNNKWYLNIPIFSKVSKKIIGIKERKQWIKVSNNLVKKEECKNGK
jgi:hypothetical protein